MTSRSFDGEYIARIIHKLGFIAVRGSSSRGAVGALFGMRQQLELGHSAIFTIDGPRGQIRRQARAGAAGQEDGDSNLMLLYRCGTGVGAAFMGPDDHSQALFESCGLWQQPDSRSRRCFRRTDGGAAPADAGSTGTVPAEGGRGCRKAGLSLVMVSARLSEKDPDADGSICSTRPSTPPADATNSHGRR